MPYWFNYDKETREYIIMHVTRKEDNPAQWTPFRIASTSSLRDAELLIKALENLEKQENVQV